MIAHFKKPGLPMATMALKGSEMNALASFLVKLTPQNAAKMSEVPQFAWEGALLYQKNQCGICHQVNGAGMNNGPPLNGLAKRRKAEWVKAHFLDPQKFDADSTMPSYKFTAAENEAIASYLMALP